MQWVNVFFTLQHIWRNKVSLIKTQDTNRISEVTMSNRNDKCKICDKKFNNRKALNSHIRRVHNKTNKKCDLCDKYFGTKYTLQDHIINIHHPENKTFTKCNHCDKSFSHKYDIKRHVRNIHEKVTYKCDTCDNFFSFRYLLKTHQNKCHGNLMKAKLVLDVQEDKIEEKLVRTSKEMQKDADIGNEGLDDTTPKE